MMEERKNKKQVLEIFEKGDLQHIEQRLRIEYQPKFMKITPKVIIDIATTEKNGQVPRSFRTDNPKRLREIIQCLIKSLHQLERDLNH